MNKRRQYISIVPCLFLVCFIINITSCSCDRKESIVERVLLNILSIGDITEVHKIPGTSYTLNWYPDMDFSTLEREPPSSESYGWEFTNVHRVFYNESFIIGMEEKTNNDLYFIIKLKSLPNGGDEQYTFVCKEDFIAAKDSLGLDDSKMSVVELNRR